MDLIGNEMWFRVGSFIGIFTLMGVAEAIWPRRERLFSRLKHWSNNLGLTFFNTFLLRMVFPTSAVLLGAYVYDNSWGLLGYIDWPPYFEILLAVVLLDFAIYLQHVMFHAVPSLWLLHRVHHVDPDYDITTGARFHPIEMIISMVIKFAVIVMLGAPAVAVVIFEIILSSLAVFNHANFKLPLAVDRVLRCFVVTPDMHRVHHSQIVRETDSNFGFNLSIWDRLMGTYIAQPKLGHDQMEIGVKEYTDPKDTVGIIGMLLLPFRK